MHIAVHDSLRGDPVLGEDVSQRFHATRFNGEGQALDAMGLACSDLACPHCRRKLPHGFGDTQQFIVSLVGDQSAGKSYYLSVLAKMLPAALYQRFGVVMQDADPTGNGALNDMKRTLFGARTPAEALLAKTQLEGNMYERLPRHGRLVPLPKPFVYSVGFHNEPSAQSASINGARSPRFSLVFYDNAGEHFQPGIDINEKPGAQHVASAAGILFLFDPFHSPDFRQAIKGSLDPQMEKPAGDLQEVILSEMRLRVASLHYLPAGERVATPLALIVGKSDAWLHLLGSEPLRDPFVDRTFDSGAVTENSRRIRELLCRLCPTIVANAEAFTENVTYFAASAFGHTPAKIGEGKYVPDPHRLVPFQVEVPPLWLISQFAAGLFPVRR